MVSVLDVLEHMSDVDPDLTHVNPLLIQMVRFDLITTLTRQVAAHAKDKQEIEDLLSVGDSLDQWASW